MRLARVDTRCCLWDRLAGEAETVIAHPDLGRPTAFRKLTCFPPARLPKPTALGYFANNAWSFSCYHFYETFPCHARAQSVRRPAPVSCCITAVPVLGQEPILRAVPAGATLRTAKLPPRGGQHLTRADRCECRECAGSRAGPRQPGSPSSSAAARCWPRRAPASARSLGWACGRARTREQADK